jgi:hypothetical protein
MPRMDLHDAGRKSAWGRLALATNENNLTEMFNLKSGSRLTKHRQEFSENPIYLSFFEHTLRRDFSLLDYAPQASSHYAPNVAPFPRHEVTTFSHTIVCRSP